MTNNIFLILKQLGLCTESSVTQFYPRVRDREDIAVLRCARSGVLFLSRTDHICEAHYTDMVSCDYWNVSDQREAQLTTAYDDVRRFDQFRTILTGKKWLDFGTGNGSLLEKMKPHALEACAVELQTQMRNAHQANGFTCKADVSEFNSGYFDVITLFHVFEHLLKPIETLKLLKSRLKPGGKIIIEVPHAEDALLSLYDIDAFKQFTFWSEHLILHTRTSISRFLEEAGFSDINVSGFQRMPLSNHLYWLKKGLPGGHIAWNYLDSPALSGAYASSLAGINKTDTLIACATA